MLTLWFYNENTVTVAISSILHITETVHNTFLMASSEVIIIILIVCIRKLSFGKVK